MSYTDNVKPHHCEKSVNDQLLKWFGWCITSDLDLSRLARAGLSTTSLTKLETLGFERNELNWIISPNKLKNRINNGIKLTPDESAKVMRVAEVLAFTVAVFSNHDKALRWLSKPNAQLDGLTPKEAMQDEFGAKLVESMLRKIDHGII